MAEIKCMKDMKTYKFREDAIVKIEEIIDY